MLCVLIVGESIYQQWFSGHCCFVGAHVVVVCVPCCLIFHKNYCAVGQGAHEIDFCCDIDETRVDWHFGYVWREVNAAQKVKVVVEGA